MSYPPCFVCGEVKRSDDKWHTPDIVDLDTGKHVHHECLKQRRDELNHEIEWNPCCEKMMAVAGDKISIDVFTETFAVYDPDNSMKYYFNGIKFCPFCGKEIRIVPTATG